MNSFLHPVHKTNFGKYQQEDVMPALKKLEQVMRKNLEGIVTINKADRTFQNTMLGFTRAGDEYMFVVGMVSHLQSVLGSTWDDVEQQAMQHATSLSTEIGQDKRYYDALVELKEVRYKTLSKNEARLLDDSIEDYELGGILLQDDKKLRQKEILLQLSKLSTEFGQNVTKQDNQAGIFVDSESELEGLDSESVEAFKNAAIEKGESDKFYIAYTPPNAELILSTVSCKNTRDAFSEMTLRKNEGANEEIARTILSLRQELAVMLGFKNHADAELYKRMAKDGQTALGFLHNLRAKYQEKAFEEHKELEEFAREHDNDPSLSLPLYESITGLDLYYAQRLKKQKFNIDESYVKEYLEISNVMDAMFEVLSKLYSVRFEKQTELDVWHEDVETYMIYDENDALIAIVRCDWYYREGKRPGAWMNSFYVADRKDGNLDRPHTGIVIGNLPRPTKTKPALLTMRDVETIWHEFGHFMHFAFTNTELEEQSMMHVKWDFVEAPSQIMENFIWEPEIVALYAKHYKTGELIALDIVDKLKKARNFRASSKALRQFVFSETDLELHMNYDPTGDVGVSKFARDYKNKLCPVETPEYDSGILAFLHIFAGGYDAAYYSYKWAEVIQADLYSRFEKEGPLNSRVGADYRDLVLARGDQEDPEVLVEDFLGRPYNDQAMLRADGVL